MRNYISVLFVIIVFMTLFISPCYAENKVEKHPKHKLMDKAIKDKLSELKDAPQEMQTLSRMAGSWNFDLQYWDEKDSVPQLSNGVTTNEFIFGNKFLSCKSSIIINMNGENIPYENQNIFGYDTQKKKFTSVFLDTFHSSIMNGTADYDKKLELFEEKGSFINPATGREQAYRGELKFLGGEGYTRSFFIKNAKDQEFKVLEITYYRQK